MLVGIFLFVAFNFWLFLRRGFIEGFVREGGG